MPTGLCCHFSHIICSLTHFSRNNMTDCWVRDADVKDSSFATHLSTQQNLKMSERERQESDKQGIVVTKKEAVSRLEWWHLPWFMCERVKKEFITWETVVNTRVVPDSRCNRGLLHYLGMRAKVDGDEEGIIRMTSSSWEWIHEMNQQEWDWRPTI